MKPTRFDAFVRAASQASSRRGLISGLAALALTPLATQAKPEPAACLATGKPCSQPTRADARSTKRARKGKAKGKPPSCSKCCSRFGAPGVDGKARCCKGEGVPCDDASQCCGGQCRNGNCTSCPGNTVFCPDGCAELRTDAKNCGTCGAVCPGDACNIPACTGGACGTVAVSCDDGNPCTVDRCDPAAGGCFHTWQNGLCTTSTGQEGYCEYGACQPPPVTLCQKNPQTLTCQCFNRATMQFCPSSTICQVIARMPDMCVGEACSCA